MLVQLQRLMEYTQPLDHLPPPGECRAIRQSVGVSMENAARLVHVTRSTVERWEREATTPRASAAFTYKCFLAACIALSGAVTVR
jgi:DNA-binding transcriptional regulator YiaG